MTFLSRCKFPALVGIFLVVVVLGSCEEDLTTIGAPVAGGTPFSTKKAVFDVFAHNKKIEAVRTNKLPVYQLGVFDDPVYGKTEASITTQVRLSIPRPTFGALSRDAEESAASDGDDTTVPDNEEVVDVFLYIPYLTKSESLRDSDGDGVDDAFDADPEDPNSDSDGDGITDNQERASGTDPLSSVNDTVQNNYAKRISLDSIYVNGQKPSQLGSPSGASHSFELKVERSTYFLRDLDPNTNFQEAQAYYSNQEFSPTFVDSVLTTDDNTVTISNEEILLTPEDNPATEDVDESQTKTHLAPGIRIPLSKSFFQTNVIDMEGSSELLSQSNFSTFLRGLHLSLPASTEDIMLLLDLTQANITTTYDYDVYNTTAGAVESRKRDFVLNLLQNQNGVISGNAVNTFKNDAYPPAILDNLDAPENASRLYVKGGAGAFAEINLFHQQVENGDEIIDQIRAKNWIINEANLVFYVDGNAGVIEEPPRLYLYKSGSNEPLIDYANENSSSETLWGLYLNYGGILEESSDTGGKKYTVRITDHINDMVLRDSTNVSLGLTLTPDITITNVANAMLANANEQDIPIVSTITPLGTVLFGSSATVAANKKLKLEIFYTEVD